MAQSSNTTPLLYDSESGSESENDVSINNRMPDEIKNSIVPEDKYNCAYVIFYLLGISTLAPWNFFITADNYWLYKFRDVNNSNPDAGRTSMQVHFLAYLTLSSTLPNTLFLILNAIFGHRFPLTLRLIGSLSVMMILFILTTVLVVIDSDKWQEMFFAVTITTVVLLNIASAILAGGLYGLVGKFGPHYITAVLSGQAFGGILSSLASIITLSAMVSPIKIALMYFMIANFVIISSLVSFIILSKSNLYNYHMSKKTIVMDVYNGESSQSDIVSFKKILEKIWMYAYNIWMVFVVTIAIYPAIIERVESEEKGSGNQWNDKYFVPVVCYLMFNVGDYVGRILAALLSWPAKKGYLLIVFTTARLMLIPMFMLCNVQPRSHLPVLIHSDVVFILLMVIFSVSNGYIANASMMNAPKLVEIHEKEASGSLMGAFLGIGLVCGSTLCIFTARLV